MITAGNFNDVFFKDIATSAVFAHGAVVATINGIFDNEFTAVRIIGGVEIEAGQPQYTSPSADVATAVHNDTLVIGDVTYYIKGIEPDGTGLTTLILSKSNVD